MDTKAVLSRCPLHPVSRLCARTHARLHVRTLHRGHVYLATASAHTAHVLLTRARFNGGAEAGAAEDAAASEELGTERVISTPASLIVMSVVLILLPFTMGGSRKSAAARGRGDAEKESLINWRPPAAVP